MSDDNEDTVPVNGTIKKSRRFTEGPIYKNVKFRLYIGYFLSMWGDNMWMFALSIALGSIGNQNMQLTAISGFLNSIVTLVFGASVGRWIDKTPRLKAASIVLIINNLSVALSSGLLFVVLCAPDKLSTLWDGKLTICVVSGSIALCAVSTLASAGTQICISKDWLVVISGMNKDKLAEMNAWTVRLELISMILAPLITGQIMTSLGQSAGCIYIALWNVVSFAVEFTLLRSIYKSCPALSFKKKPVGISIGKDGSTIVADECDTCPMHVTTCVHRDVEALVLDHHVTKDASASSNKKKRQHLTANGSSSGSSKSNFTNCTSAVSKHVVSSLNGWKIYYKQPIFNAGLGLALLYLTVLGLDGITTVYTYSQGLHENAVALYRGVGAVIGILGSVGFPYLRKRIGVTRTGIYALTAQIACNLLTVISVWLPGSPFDPVGYFSDDSNGFHVNSADHVILTNSSTNRYHHGIRNSSTNHVMTSMTSSSVQQHSSRSDLSITVFLVGIVFARFGLWMADMSITQLMQENIAEHERGVINGVQNALNQTLNMVKDILVILLPDPRTFGVLIIVSCCSVLFGFASFLLYARKPVVPPSDADTNGQLLINNNSGGQQDAENDHRVINGQLMNPGDQQETNVMVANGHLEQSAVVVDDEEPTAETRLTPNEA